MKFIHIFDAFSKVATTAFSQKIFEPNPRIPESIDLFPGLLSRGIECAIRSGYCSNHNSKIVRKVTSKKMSYIGVDGKLQWKMCEVTILACPYKLIPGQPRAPTEHVQPTSLESKGTNQKRRKFEDSHMNQSQHRKTEDQVK